MTTLIENASDKSIEATPPDFSVIIPCFNEAASIGEFSDRLMAALAKTRYCFELIYVNDGSNDGTFDCLYTIYKDNDASICLVDLAQNVGQTNALTAGLQYATGKHIIILDCDLQVAPEDICLLIEKFDDSYDMVSGARIQRKDNPLRVQLSRLGNACIRRTLGLPLYDFGSGMKILNGAFVRAFEPGPFRPVNPGALMLSLRHVAEVPITHHARESGRSRWTLRRFYALYHNIFRHLIPFIYPFTVAPLLVLSLLLLVYFALATIFPEYVAFTERPAMMPMLITLNIALSFVSFLLLGEFVLRGSSQVQEPTYIVRRVFLAKDAPKTPVA